MQLPTEIMAEIVKNCGTHNTPHRKTLIALCRVSRPWKDLAQPRLWSSIWYSSKPELKAVLTTLKAYPRLGHFVKIVDISQYPDRLSKDSIYLHWPPVESLHDQRFLQLVEKWDRLKETYFRYNPKITEDGWISAAPFLKTLRSLRIDHAPHFRDKAVIAVIDSCPLLEDLELRYSDITGAAVSHIMLNASKLVELRIYASWPLRLQDIEEILWQRPARLYLFVDGRDGMQYWSLHTPLNQPVVRHLPPYGTSRPRPF
ncbi:hypothetical protein DFS34DRAFT_691268 [Phlyctochytrium arcticum]|nr:hypothetical protein DFS34DRAFT_691268 [Phlyctochytrium arcticum]